MLTDLCNCRDTVVSYFCRYVASVKTPPRASSCTLIVPVSIACTSCNVVTSVQMFKCVQYLVVGDDQMVRAGTRPLDVELRSSPPEQHHLASTERLYHQASDHQPLPTPAIV
jgi:hypothetical protein